MEDNVPGYPTSSSMPVIVIDHDVVLVDAHDTVYGALDQIALEGDGLEELLTLVSAFFPLQEQGDS